jgi:amino acid adenylation domain-containing protein/non-ribosomal peptide synthase protein (TIGR01720 family)
MKRLTNENIKNIYPTSPMQQGMYFHYLLDKSSPVYFVQFSYRLHGELKVNLVEKSLNEILKRHDALRTVFNHEKKDILLQVVLKEQSIDFFYKDISKMSSKKEKEEFIEKYRERDRRNLFDLGKSILIRAALLQLGKDEYEFVWSFHHILMDGWCVNILTVEFLEIYRSYIENREYQLPPVKQYSSYIKWLGRRDPEASKIYWGRYLAGYKETTGITKIKEYNWGGKNKYQQEQVLLTLGREETASLNKIAGKSQVTLNCVVQSIWGVILGKYNNKEDVVFGAVVSGRPSEIEEIERMVGLFINTIPVRIRFDSETPFNELIQLVQEDSLRSETHHHYPLAKIQSGSYLKQNLIDHILAFENHPLAQAIEGMVNTNERTTKELTLTISNTKDFQQTNYDFNLIVTPGDRLELAIQYNSNTYNNRQVERVVNTFNHLVTQVINNNHTKIKELEIISEKEKKQLLYDFNDTSVQYPGHMTISALFREQVGRTPDRISVVGNRLLAPGKREDVQLTYRELNSQSDQLAHLLRKKGVQANIVVGLMAERSPREIIGILAIIKAGGAYLPIDPGNPTDRIINLLNDANAHLLLTGDTGTANHSFTALQQPFRGLPREIALSPPRSCMIDLDQLPIPNRSLVNYQKYNQYIGLTLVKNSISMLGTRGCPYNCAYCSKIWPKKYFVRSAENLLEEIKLYYNMGVRRFDFVDDIFNLDMKNSQRFFRLIIREGLNLQLFFSAGLRGDLLTEEYIDLMVQAGTVNMALALETASPRLQKLIGKNLNLEKLRKNIEYISRKYPHVILELFTMHGFPTETQEEAMMTLEFIKSIKWLHFPYVHILKIYPNTDMEKLALDNGISARDIASSMELAYHQLPETLPFDKSFTQQYQAEFLNTYFLNKERLLTVLPHQVKSLTEDEILQKYNSYLPIQVTSLQELLHYVGIESYEPSMFKCLPEEQIFIPHINEKMKQAFPAEPPGKNAFKILLLDLSQHFSSHRESHYDPVEPPLGLMYILTWLNREMGSQVHGRIAKSRIDFDSWHELGTLLEEFKPDLIGIRTLTYYRQFFHKTVSIIRQWGIDVPLIAGGPYASSDYQTLLQDTHVGLAVLGEGEVTFTQLVKKIIENNRRLPNQDVLKTIEGLAFLPESKRKEAKTANREIIMPNTLDYLLQGESPKNLRTVNKPTDLAYIIFTSGSTGKPKGVLVEHYPVVNLAFSQKKYFNITEDDRVLLFSSICFDASVEQIFISLFSGATLVLIDKHTLLDSRLFEGFIASQGITHIHAVPSFLNNIQLKNNYKLKRIIAGGDVCPVSLAKRWMKHCDFYNEYGPTETTVTSIELKVKEVDEALPTLPIGTPINNTTVYLLDRGMKLVPLGVVGEMYIGGEGVARGYLNRPELTAEKFVERVMVTGAGDRFRWEENKQKFLRMFHGSRGRFLQKEPPGRRRQKMYKTGDLALWLKDGNIEFLGRMDLQVKIRGFRIELGEIEFHLMNHPGVNEAVVIAREANEGDRYLCAYIRVSEHGPGSIEPVVLRDYLSGLLPDYMIPSYFVQLEKMPLTPTGKIDKNALPGPGQEKIKDHCAAPRNEKEKQLAKIWENVLGRSPIDINDNFFMIGGDSIKAIQIAARLGLDGYSVSISDIFQAPTIAQLAPKIKESHPLAEQSFVTGKIPLTPIQKRFFQEKTNEIHHFNQSVLLYSERGFEAEEVKAVFTKIQQHHDALRMTFTREKTGDTIQYNHGPGHPLSLKVTDLRNKPDPLAELEKEANRIQAAIDLENGNLMKLGLFRMDDGDRLLIVVHHLVIDGVSWRILLEDIQALFQQYANKESLKLPPRTDSFKRWSEELQKYANSPQLLGEMEYWQELESRDIPPLGQDFYTGENLEKDAKTHAVTLEEKETSQLLTNVNHAFGTRINDILLSALGLSFKKHFGSRRILIALEGHGREKVMEHMNIDRTVGWFTSIFPVILDIEQENDTARLIKEVKETLWRIPANGISYGILKYLTAAKYKKNLEFRLRPQVSFNYLGQFDKDIKNLSFKLETKHMGNGFSGNQQREFLLDINGIIAGKRLTISLTYNKKQYKTAAIKKLLDTFHIELKRIISFCAAREVTELTPCDLTYRGLTIEALHRLQQQYQIEDVYRLTPMQEGILFHISYNKNTLTYFEQNSIRLQGKFDIHLVKKSFIHLAKRHDVLRTMFIIDQFEYPLQMVLRNRQPAFIFSDISTSLQPGNQESFLQSFREEDRARGFDLKEDALMRLSVLRVNPSQYEFVWSFHHIILDGWCVGILISDFFEIYNSYLENRAHDLPPTNPYRNYVQWLEKQDKESAKEYWRRCLDGFNEAANIPAVPGNHSTKKEYKANKHSFPLGKKITTALNRIAGKNQVTLNTVIQAIWGIILGCYNNKQDVIFGVVVSGRPAKIPHVERMVGLFLNTIPVRVRLSPGMTFQQLLENIQKEAMENENHQYYPLPGILSETPLGKELFDHIMIFENYPIEKQIDNAASKEKKKDRGHLKFHIVRVESFGLSEYDLNILFHPGDDLIVELIYNQNVIDEQFIKRIETNFRGIFEQIIDNPAVPLEAIKIKTGYFTLTEKQQAVYKETPHLSVNLLEGELEKEKVENIFRQLINRHEVLKTTFTRVGKRTLQYIGDEVEFSLEYHDLIPIPNHPPGVPDPIIDNFKRPFDLHTPPLIRTGLLEIQQGKHILLLAVHPLAADEFSIEILLKEFMELYGGNSLPALKPGYRDYLETREKNKPERHALPGEQEKYWLEEFENPPLFTDLPGDSPPCPDVSAKHDVYNFPLDRDEVCALRKIAEKESVEPSTVFLTIFAVMVSRLCRQEDIVIGRPVRTCPYPGMEKTVAPLENILPLRLSIHKESSFAKILREANKKTTKALENRDIPFETLREKIPGNSSGDSGGSIPNGIIFRYRQKSAAAPCTLELKDYKYSPTHRDENFTLTCSESHQDILLSFRYSSNRFKPDTIGRYSNYFKEILAGTIKNGDIKVKDITIASDLKAAKSSLLEKDTGDFDF